MDTNALIQPLQSMLAPFGITDAWVAVAAFFAVLWFIFFIVFIVGAVRKHQMKRQIIDLTDYVLGLEAMTNLQPLSIPDNLGRNGIRPISMPTVAPDADCGFQETGSGFGWGSPYDEDCGYEDATHNVTAAVHDAIYASVSGRHEAIRPDAASRQDVPSGKKAMAEDDVSKTDSQTFSGSSRPVETAAAACTAEHAVSVNPDHSDLSGRIPRI